MVRWIKLKITSLRNRCPREALQWMRRLKNTRKGRVEAYYIRNLVLAMIVPKGALAEPGRPIKQEYGLGPAALRSQRMTKIYRRMVVKLEAIVAEAWIDSTVKDYRRHIYR
jgi:hypothetical protein